ncbi:MAG TPA: cupredoxin domain-containing protein [Nitrospiria bacterium]|nr:cupredoxin domain-containing protein [Nitrospiria bacterium]
MRILQQNVRTRLLLGIVGLSLIFLFADSPVLTALETGKVEIVIRNSTFEFQGGALRPDMPGTLLLRNLDKIQHGFTSPLLEELDVRVESADVITYGKGIKGVYINPGETLQIYFTPTRPGSFAFRCDIHPNMKGELLLLSVGEV